MATKEAKPTIPFAVIFSSEGSAKYLQDWLRKKTNSSQIRMNPYNTENFKYWVVDGKVNAYFRTKLEARLVHEKWIIRYIIGENGKEPNDRWDIVYASASEV